LDKLKDDPTALWYFLTIHDSILYPFCRFFQWKLKREGSAKRVMATTTDSLEDATTMAVKRQKTG